MSSVIQFREVQKSEPSRIFFVHSSTWPFGKFHIASRPGLGGSDTFYFAELAQYGNKIVAQQREFEPLDRHGNRRSQPAQPRFTAGFNADPEYKNAIQLYFLEEQNERMEDYEWYGNVWIEPWFESYVSRYKDELRNFEISQTPPEPRMTGERGMTGNGNRG
jgi:hypothetical protein